MELLNRLKRLILGGDDIGGEAETAGRGAEPRAFEPRGGKVMLVKPDLYANVGRVTDYLCAGHMVLLDLSAVTADGARRIVDFLSGAAYSKDGVLLQVSSRAYLLAPATVDVSDGSRRKEEGWSYGRALNF